MSAGTPEPPSHPPVDPGQQGSESQGSPAPQSTGDSTQPYQSWQTHRADAPDEAVTVQHSGQGAFGDSATRVDESQAAPHAGYDESIPDASGQPAYGEQGSYAGSGPGYGNPPQPAYGEQGYGDQGYGSQQPAYGEQGSYAGSAPGYGDQGSYAGSAPGYGDQGYGSQQPAYGEQGSYAGSAPGYGDQPGYADQSAGYAAPAAAAPLNMSATPQPAGRRTSSKPLIISLIAAGCVVLLIVVSLAVLTWVNTNRYSPDVVVDEYLTALEAGDFSAAESIAEPVIANDASPALLNSEVPNAGPDRITDASIQEMSIEGDSASATVTYKIAGQDNTLPLTLEKAPKDNIFDFFDTWVLTGPTLQTVSLEIPAGIPATVNGVSFEPPEDATGAVEYAVYPGTYEVGVESSRFIEATGDTATVAFSDQPAPSPTVLNVNATATDALTDEVQNQVDAKIDDCAGDTEIKTSADDGCPFWFPSGNNVATDASEIDIDVKSKPTIDVYLTDPENAAFSTSSPGRWNYRAPHRDGNGYWYNIGDVDLRMNGTITISGDSVELTFTTF